MATTTTPDTTIEVDPTLPTIRIVREFDAPRERVFRAWTDPELYARWLGPDDITTEIAQWDARTGGAWRWSNSRDGRELAVFWGSFHEVRLNDRIVQTVTFDEYPDGVCLETILFEDLGDGRTRVTDISLVDSLEARDGMVASGMEHGVIAGYAKLDALLAGGEA
ncbi:polyketide cyclase [Leifsonia sp. Leaf325]|nr:SRPBCC family protein [Leifsonia sp. Leaf325]KQQ92789.1 polyketide cyclase [Leifsonia sp. Leaf325]